MASPHRRRPANRTLHHRTHHVQCLHARARDERDGNGAMGFPAARYRSDRPRDLRPGTGDADRGAAPRLLQGWVESLRLLRRRHLACADDGGIHRAAGASRAASAAAHHDRAVFATRGRRLDFGVARHGLHPDADRPHLLRMRRDGGEPVRAGLPQSVRHSRRLAVHAVHRHDPWKDGWTGSSVR